MNNLDFVIRVVCLFVAGVCILVAIPLIIAILIPFLIFLCSLGVIVLFGLFIKNTLVLARPIKKKQIKKRRKHGNKKL